MSVTVLKYHVIDTVCSLLPAVPHTTTTRKLCTLSRSAFGLGG
jgi:hypothetical protein